MLASVQYARKPVESLQDGFFEKLYGICQYDVCTCVCPDFAQGNTDTAFSGKFKFPIQGNKRLCVLHNDGICSIWERLVELSPIDKVGGSPA